MVKNEKTDSLNLHIMICTCVWKKRQFCVCSRSLTLKDLSITLNRSRNEDQYKCTYKLYCGCERIRDEEYNIYISLHNPLQKDNSQILLTACETEELLFYLGIITKNMKADITNEEEAEFIRDYIIFKYHTFCIESVTTIRDSKKVHPSILEIIQGEKVHTLIEQIYNKKVTGSLKISRDSTFAMYDYLKAIFQLNHNDLHDWIKDKIKFGYYQQTNTEIPTIDFNLFHGCPYY